MNNRAVRHAFGQAIPYEFIELLERVERMEILIERELLDDIKPEDVCNVRDHAWVSVPWGSPECRRCPAVKGYGP